MQTDGGYVPVAWVARWAAAKPPVRGLEKNKQGETVVDGNIYVDMLSAHLHGREGLASAGIAGRPAIPGRPERTRRTRSGPFT